MNGIFCWHPKVCKCYYEQKNYLLQKFKLVIIKRKILNWLPIPWKNAKIFTHKKIHFCSIFPSIFRQKLFSYAFFTAFNFSNGFKINFKSCFAKKISSYKHFLQTLKITRKKWLNFWETILELYFATINGLGQPSC